MIDKGLQSTLTCKPAVDAFLAELLQPIPSAPNGISRLGLMVQEHLNELAKEVASAVVADFPDLKDALAESARAQLRKLWENEHLVKQVTSQAVWAALRD